MNPEIVKLTQERGLGTVLLTNLFSQNLVSIVMGQFKRLKPTLRGALPALTRLIWRVSLRWDSRLFEAVKDRACDRAAARSVLYGFKQASHNGTQPLREQNDHQRRSKTAFFREREQQWTAAVELQNFSSPNSRNIFTLRHCRHNVAADKSYDDHDMNHQGWGDYDVKAENQFG
jgi:hypothetical protein